MHSIQLVIFPVTWLIALGLAGFYMTKKRSRFDAKVLILYVMFMAMLGPVGEILVGTLYQATFGHALWQYRIFPTHSGYTSLYAPVIWGIAGAYLYVSHELVRIFSGKAKPVGAAVHMVETIVLEVLLNATFIAMSGRYIFYYTPGDLGHLTSLQTLPFYYALGLVLVISIKRLKHDPRFNAAMFASIMAVVVYMTH